MDKRFDQFQHSFFLVLDLLLLNFIYLLKQEEIEVTGVSDISTNHIFYWVLINVAWISCTWLGEVYSSWEMMQFKRFLKITFTCYLAWTFIILSLSFLMRSYVTLSREFVYAAVFLFAPALLLNRIIFLATNSLGKVKLNAKRRILIVGYNKLAQKLVSYLENEDSEICIVGYVEEHRKVTELSNYPVFGGIDHTIKIAKRERITDVYSTIMPEDNSNVYKMMKQADNDLIRFKLVPDLEQFISGLVQLDYLYDVPILSIRKEPLEVVMNRFKKRWFDILVSLFVGIFILSWLIPILGIIIYMQSPGPIFFVQLRSGKGNRPFRCFKFRSMTVNSQANQTQATKNDARVTAIGRFMRKTSLDEFPQFLNVLFGQMSIIGPRPHMLKHTKDFSIQDEQYMVRQFLKPGISGWAQVNGYRGEITELEHIQKRVEYDLWYLENWSLSLDLKIIFLTVFNVFKGEKNAY